MIERNRKKIRVLYWTVLVVAGLGLGFLSGVMAWSVAGRIAAVLGLSAAALLVALGIDQLWFREFCREVDSLSPLLERDPDAYIREMERRLEGKRAPLITGILRINIAAALCDRGDYRGAQVQLEEVGQRKIPASLRTVYALDSAYVAFWLGEGDRARSILGDHREEFQRMRDDPHLGPTLAALAVKDLLDVGEWAEAREALEEARQRWNSPRDVREFDRLAQELPYDAV